MFREAACQTSPERATRGLDAGCQTECAPRPRCRFCGVGEQAAAEQIDGKTPRRGGDTNHSEIGNGVGNGDESNAAAQRVDARTPAVKVEEGPEASRHTPLPPTHPINTDVKMETDLMIVTVKEEQVEVGVEHGNSGAVCEDAGRSRTNVDPVNPVAGMQTLFKEHQDDIDISSNKDIKPAEINIIVVGDLSVKQEEGSERSIGYKDFEMRTDLHISLIKGNGVDSNGLNGFPPTRFVKSNQDPRDAEFLRESLPSVCSAAGNKRSDRTEDWVESRTRAGEGKVNVENPRAAKEAKKSRRGESTS